jgi:Protein of unknown function (DUF1345)
VKVTPASAKPEPSDKAGPSRKTRSIDKTRSSKKIRSSDTTKVPRSCSDVFRFWMSIGVGLVVGLMFEITVILLQVTGTRPVPTDEQFNLEFGFGARLTVWIGFAITYLALGLRAFSRCDRAELVRRVLAKPLPASRVKRWLLAGGGGSGWPVAIALVAFVTIITALLSRSHTTNLVLVLAAGTVVTCWMVITFSFALQYARRDIEQGGLTFPGSQEPVFADYNYLAIGCSATFGTTDTTIVSTSMRRLVSVHSVIGLLLNTVVVAVLLSIIVS